MYFTPDGRYAIVVAEARQHLDFRDPHTFALEHRIHVDCAGVDHIDFAANGAYLIATCEFAGRLVRVDLHTLKVVGYLNLPGSAPQDIKLDPAGRTFYVADKNHAGVWLIDAATFRPAGFIPTGPDAHGLYPSRDASYLYVTNRGNGSITVISFATRKIVTTWRIPGGGSPDMGGAVPGREGVLGVRPLQRRRLRHLHVTGRLLAKIPVGVAAARAVRMAPAGPLLPRPHRDHPMSSARFARGRVRARVDAGRAGAAAGLAGAAPASGLTTCSPGWDRSRSAPPRCAPGLGGR